MYLDIMEHSPVQTDKKDDIYWAQRYSTLFNRIVDIVVISITIVT